MFSLCLCYGHSWNALFYYLSKYISVLSIALVGMAIRSLLLKGPNLPQPIFEAVLAPLVHFSLPKKASKDLPWNYGVIVMHT